MKRFLIVIEKANGNYSAYSPDLPGCVATGKTVDETEANMYEAIRLHLEGLVEEGMPVPEARSLAEYVALPEVGSFKEGTQARLSDKVRKFVYENYVLPARESGEQTVKVRAGDVHKAMGLRNRLPLVCSALGSRKFERTFGIRRTRLEGPNMGANAVFWFALNDEVSPKTGE